MHLTNGFSLTLTGLLQWLHLPPALLPLALYVIDALLILLGVVMPVVTALIYLLRKVIGFIQRRLGPMRAGPFGALQTIADAIKLLHKEDLMPANADKLVFLIAPFLVFVPAVLVYVVIPFGKSQGLFTGNSFITKDLNVGVVYMTAITSVTAVGIIAAGWSSDNKWSLLGALRSAAQLVSYELPMTLALLSPALLSGSLALGVIVDKQSSSWFVFPQILAFLIYFIAALSEISHTPFDLPEAESELVAGYNVEYSGMRFGLFFLGEFANSFTISAIAVTLFLGGWHLLPGWDPIQHLSGWQSGMAAAVVFVLLCAAALASGRFIAGKTSATDANLPSLALAGMAAIAVIGAGCLGLISVVVFLFKTSVLVFVLMWVRGTLPRVRIDQLMNFGWKVLVPVALVNFLALSFEVATGIPTGVILNVLFWAFLIVLVPLWAWRKRWAYSAVSETI